jgi:hypothetical protein
MPQTKRSHFLSGVPQGSLPNLAMREAGTERGKSHLGQYSVSSPLLCVELVEVLEDSSRADKCKHLFQNYYESSRDN